ncbi:MAG: hypoxanthine phosphoribosyltransferase [Phycisphaerales bacterium]|nr:hypoxanthine phosphoribosyltransferase [Phycisphaerales bacterium]
MPGDIENDIDRVLIDRDRIAARVAELGRQIAADLERDTKRHPSDEHAGEIVLVPILTGSIIFLADLIRSMPLKMQIRVISVSSYAGRTTQSRGAQLAGELPPDIEGSHVLIVDDILDSGRTIRLVRKLIAERKPATLRTCVLLRKEIPEAMATPCDYVGFDVPNEFIVGAGLDYNGYYRNLPDLVTLRPEAM